MRGLWLLPILLAVAACGSGNSGQPFAQKQATKHETVQFRATDGVQLYATYSEPANPHALILLFHQAGGGQGEYDTIAPELVAEGYATLTVDQRAGGDMFGGNWTVKALNGREPPYLDAKKDLEAALAWAKAKRMPVILWGSSYSASLALMVAAEHPSEVTAVLAFSPGEYFDGNPSVHDAAARIGVPVFMTSAMTPEEIAATRTLFDAVPGGDKRLFVPRLGGVHGSSTLNPTRNPQGAGKAWDAVLGFLRGVALN